MAGMTAINPLGARHACAERVAFPEVAGLKFKILRTACTVIVTDFW